MSRTKRDFVGATRSKLALVAVLALILAWVLASNFRGEAVEAAPEPPVIAAAAAPQASPASVSRSPDQRDAKASPFAEFAIDDDWPEVPLEQLVRFDPLKKPEWLAPSPASDEATAEANEQTIQDLQNATNAIIFVSGGERVAHIGSHEYRVGDMVGDYLITDISSAGIVLSPPETGAATAN
jgi:uncharacterized protein YdeI (BOF family)